jgi:hypothetical protein
MSFVIGQQVVFTSENSFRKLGRITGIHGNTYTILPNGSNSASSSVTASATNKSILPYFDISTLVTVTLTNKHSRGAQKWKGVVKGVRDENVNLKYNIELIDVAGTPTFTAYPNQVSKRETSETVGFSTSAPFASVEPSKNSAKVHTPSATTSVPTGVLPIEWSATKNETGRTYYYKLNGETTYDWPGTTSKTTVATASSAPANSSTVATASSASASSSTVATASSASDLPEGWGVDYDIDGTPYYIAPSGDTQWEHPTQTTPASASATVATASSQNATVSSQNATAINSSIASSSPASSASALPEGWAVDYDEDGTPYYISPSNETQWEYPSLPTVTVSAPQPKAVKRVKLLATNNLSTFNKPATKTNNKGEEDRVTFGKSVPRSHATKRSKKKSNNSSTNSRTNSNSVSVSTNASENELPSGWISLVDPESGDTSYENESTGKTTWDKPTQGGSRKKRHIRTRRKSRR